VRGAQKINLARPPKAFGGLRFEIFWQRRCKLKRKEILQTKIVEYYHLKKEFDRLEKRKNKLKLTIVNRMKNLDITDIQIGRYHGKTFRKAVFLSDEKIAKIKKLLPHLPQTKVIKPVQIFIIDKKKIDYLLKKGKISVITANCLEWLGEEDFLEVRILKKKSPTKKLGI